MQRVCTGRHVTRSCVQAPRFNQTTLNHDTASTVVLDAYRTGGIISGNNVEIYADRTLYGATYTLLRAYGGGEIRLSNSTASLTSTTQSGSYHDRLFLAQDAGSLLNIANT